MSGRLDAYRPQMRALGSSLDHSAPKLNGGAEEVSFDAELARVPDSTVLNAREEQQQTEKSEMLSGTVRQAGLPLARFFILLWHLMTSNAVLLAVLSALATAIHVGLVLDDDDKNDANDLCLTKEEFHTSDILMGPLADVCDCVKEPLRAA